jgi:hypothetical protein
MHKFVKQHVMYVWIAMLGVMFSALAPSISYALAASAQPDEEVQVCTMAGMKTIAVTADPSGRPASPDHFAKHCPYCAVHCGMGPLLPTAQFVFALPAVSSSFPPLFYQSAKPPFAWMAAKPRGPPGQA